MSEPQASESVPSSPAAEIGDPGSSARWVYILYLAGLVVGITTLIGVIMAYVSRSEAPEWVRSHYQYQIRTFWIGFLYGIVGALLSAVLIGFVVLLFAVIWYIVRCVKGLQWLSARKPVPDPRTWLF